MKLCEGSMSELRFTKQSWTLQRKKGCYNVTLNVWSCNEKAMKFYQARGLKPQKIGMEVILSDDRDSVSESYEPEKAVTD